MTKIDFESEAFVVMKPGDDFTITPIILDEVRDDEFLIEMQYSGICHTVSWPSSASIAR